MNFAIICCILLISRQATGNTLKTLAVRTAPEGDFSSPGFPVQYPPYLDTAWRIEQPKGHRIRLQFLKFSVEWDIRCSFDKVTVYDGYNSSAKKLGVYCGNDLPHPLISTGRFLYIRMLTDNSVSSPGFLAHYKCFKDPTVEDTTTQSVATTATETTSTTSTTPAAGTKVGFQVTEETSTKQAGRRPIVERNPDVPTIAPRNVPAVPRASTASTKYPLFRYGWFGPYPFRSPSRRRRQPLGSLHITSVGLGHFLNGAAGTTSPQWIPILLGMSTLLR
ncbi:Zinc metalloproteinase nas-39 [Clonorchis sinensis]|uniref:Zinc metalloproteinase nas-39 n=1 Tax=Clonorchis sinensis TaxID=79923 RepID=A0A8T1M4Q4_CLOSI|nr:Zinc metalloproteinase nas-39 [Clonorchis sinensis]